MSPDTLSLLADIAQIVSVVPLTVGGLWFGVKLVRRIRITLDPPSEENP